MNRNEQKTKIFSLFVEFLVAENRPSQKNIEGETKEQKIGKTKHKLRSQNYRFASNQIANFYSFRFMPAQLTRFGIDRNSAILSIAWRVILLSNFILLQRFIFPHDCFAWW